MRIPQRTAKDDGTPRRAGFEFEFAGLEPAEAARTVARVLGGEVRAQTPFSLRIEGGRYGAARVEMDAAVLKERRYLDALGVLGVEIEPRLLEGLETALLGLSATLVPCEAVLPPIPLAELDVLEEVREALRLRRAKGTRASLAYAFGMHMNVEPPDTSPATLTAYLRAFLLLHDLIREESEVDLTRTISPYIDRFPDEYVRLAVNPSYAPGSVEDLAADYLRHNPTRNRPLDMLPLLAHLAPEAVADRLRGPEAKLVKARPAFHYRLPNCRIDEAGWTVASEWDHWLEVERLAAAPDAMVRLGREYLDMPDFSGRLFTSSWAERSRRLLRG